MSIRPGSAQSRGGAVLLAAGDSSRMGEPKALLRHADGRSFLRAACDALEVAGLFPVVAVLGGKHRARIEAALESERQTAVCFPRVVINPAPERGQISSLALGLDALALEVPFAAIALVDQPSLPLAVLARLLEQAAREPQAVHVPLFRGVRGHPAIFPTSLAPALLDAHASESARDVIARLGVLVRELAVEEPAVLVDLDTPEELAAWRAAEAR